MKQGEIKDSQAWFGFTVDQLYWLMEKISRRDAFHDQIRNAIKDLETESAPLQSNTEE